MNKYRIVMKNGREYEFTLDESQNPVGLWVWSLRESYPRVLNFGDTSLLSTEIQSVETIEGIRGSNYGTKNNSSYDFNAPLPQPPQFSFPERQY